MVLFSNQADFLQKGRHKRELEEKGELLKIKMRKRKESNFPKGNVKYMKISAFLYNILFKGKRRPRGLF